jgi:colicin import membrane protein
VHWSYVGDEYYKLLGHVVWPGSSKAPSTPPSEEEVLTPVALRALESAGAKETLLNDLMQELGEAEEQATAKAAAGAKEKAQAEKKAQAKAEAEAKEKAKAEKQAKAKAEAEAKGKAKAKAEAQGKGKAKDDATAPAAAAA